MTDLSIAKRQEQIDRALTPPVNELVDAIDGAFRHDINGKPISDCHDVLLEIAGCLFADPEPEEMVQEWIHRCYHAACGVLYRQAELHFGDKND